MHEEPRFPVIRRLENPPIPPSPWYTWKRVAAPRPINCRAVDCTLLLNVEITVSLAEDVVIRYASYPRHVGVNRPKPSTVVDCDAAPPTKPSRPNGRHPNPQKNWQHRRWFRRRRRVLALELYCESSTRNLTLCARHALPVTPLM